MIDLDDDTRTENTRASYPLDFIDNAVPEKAGRAPEEHHLPHLRRLRRDAADREAVAVTQALYHFISGYTSKIAGTEIGLGEEPEITFSACFGGPFMVHRPAFYAEAPARARSSGTASNCWLVNTGWVGGPYGVGKRISIQYTRDLLNAALDGKLLDVEYFTDPVFGFAGAPRAAPRFPTTS